MPTNHLQNTLLRTINFAKSIKQLRLLTGVGGVANEPAFSIGDDIRSIILSPPFAWSWNRKDVAIAVTEVLGQDYTESIADFGWIEKAVIDDGNGKIKELTVKNAHALAPTSVKEQPASICVYEDDNEGGITFRVAPAPPTSYTLTVIYQKAPPIFASTSDDWDPIPDRFSYLYNTGFIAKAYEKTNDPRFLPTFSLFMRLLVSANGGLSETDVNLFLEGQLNPMWANTASLQQQGFGAASGQRR